MRHVLPPATRADAGVAPPEIDGDALQWSRPRLSRLPHTANMVAHLLDPLTLASGMVSSS